MLLIQAILFFDKPYCFVLHDSHVFVYIGSIKDRGETPVESTRPDEQGRLRRWRGCIIRLTAVSVLSRMTLGLDPLGVGGDSM